MVEECWRTVMGGAGWGLHGVPLRAGISAGGHLTS